MAYLDEINALGPVAYWRLGESNVSSIDDDFTGNNGDPINPSLWITTLESTVTNSIQSNKCNIQITDDAANRSFYARAIHIPTGDFDVQIDVQTTTSTGYNSFGFQLYSESDDARYFITRRYNFVGGTARDFEVASYAWDYSGAEVFTDLSGDPSSYKLRLVRTGTTLKAYIWTGSQWDWQGNTAGYTFLRSMASDDFILEFRAVRYGAINSGDLNINADDFTVTADGYANTIAADETSNNYDGTIIGGPTLGQTSLQVSDADASAAFIASSYMNAEHAFGTVKSMTFLVNPTTLTGEDTILSLSDGATVVRVYIDNSNSNYLTLTDGTTTVATTTALNTGSTYHVVVTNDTGDIDIYVDGTSVLDSTETLFSGLTISRVAIHAYKTV